MSESFNSTALKVNLSETRQDSVELPAEHEYFLTLSKSHYGINESVRELFFEYHHKYPNREFISDRVRKVAIGDFWFYARADEPERAFGVILDLINEQLAQPLSSDVHKSLVRTHVDLMEKFLRHDVIYEGLLNRSLNELQGLLKSNEIIILLNSSAIRRQLSSMSDIPDLSSAYYNFYRELCTANINFWQSTTRIDKWLDEKGHFFSEESLVLLRELGKGFYARYMNLIKDGKDTAFLEEHIPMYFEFSGFYREYVDRLVSFQDKFHYLFYLLHIPGMSHQRDHLMYDLMVVLKNIFSDMDAAGAVPFLDDAFELFLELIETNTIPVLACNRTLGQSLVALDDYFLCRYFSRKTIEMGFVSPESSFNESEWRISVNPAHIANIRSWLEIIQQDTVKYQLLLAGLTANLKIGGVMIFDTDLFQKDVTKLLNANIKPVYELVKQLCRIFPVFFNEIGAEGELREVTTLLDELTKREDLLIHYLRKQVHTESNNTHIDLTFKIFEFWTKKDISLINGMVPADVLDSVDVDGESVSGMNEIIHHISDNAGIPPQMLLTLDDQRLAECIDAAPEYDDVSRMRLKHICRLYKLLREKYSFSTVDICGYLRKFRLPSSETVDKLEQYLNNDETENALESVFGIMEELNSIIFSRESTEGWENIYYKRHIAYGIPSMYGTYHEEKFESLGKIFKIERTASALLQKLENDINLDYITVDSLQKIYRVLKHYKRGLEIDGVSIKALDNNLEMFRYSLRSRSFSIKQYVNMFRFIGESIRQIIKEYFFRPYDNVLKIIIPKIFDCSSKDEKQAGTFIHQKSEEFYRDMLSSTFLLQSLDSFISRIDAAMHSMVDSYSKEMIRDIMTFEPDMVISPIYRENPKLDNQVFLGLKAYNLKKLYLLGYPVPPGFVISTEIFRRKDTFLNHPVLVKDIDRKLKVYVNELEKLTGKQLGNKNNPLMLSVRSGAAFSMPGAMNTFLNVGINEELADALSRKENYGWTAWDCYRRFLQTWGISNGLDRKVFDDIMLDYRKAYNVSRKIDLTPKQMRDIIHSYREVIEKNNIYIEDEPFAQLRSTIINVMNSWNKDLAITYRRILDVADEWGTAVLVQKMVLGNLNYTSGTGVLFTHADYSDLPGININGDFSHLSQGEDIVGGRVNPFAISSDQPYISNPEFSLQNAFPALHAKLHNISVQLLEKHGFNHQEIEFTFESNDPNDLFILQVRDQSISAVEDKTVFEGIVNDDKVLGNGIGIGNGVLNGRIIFTSDDLSALRAEDEQANAILVRSDTVPEDIGLIYECEGLITSRGGATSHAAVTAARLGKKCIVNTTGLVVDEKNSECYFNGEKIRSKDKVAIDSNSGYVYRGNYTVMTLK